MGLPCDGWKNKVGTGERSCSCGTWSQHWINFSNKKWPKTCSVSGCSNEATLGAHVYNHNVSGERIVPMCNSCNKLKDEFSLKGGVTAVHANQSKTCGKA